MLEFNICWFGCSKIAVYTTLDNVKCSYTLTLKLIILFLSVCAIHIESFFFENKTNLKLNLHHRKSNVRRRISIIVIHIRSFLFSVNFCCVFVLVNVNGKFFGNIRSRVCLHWFIKSNDWKSFSVSTQPVYYTIYEFM